MRSMSRIGCALLVCIAISGLAAPSSLASQFKSTASPVTFFGEQEVAGKHKWEVEKETVQCPKAAFEAMKVTTPTKTLSMVPTWQTKNNECTAFLFTTTEVVAQGCTFEFQEPTPVGLNFEGKVAIRCPSGKFIKLRGESVLGVCEVQIGETGNTSLSRITYSNGTAIPSNFSATFQISGISATKAIAKGSCPFKTGTTKTVSYTGLTNFEGVGGIGVKIE